MSFMYVCVCIHMCVYTYVCVCVCIYVFTFMGHINSLSELLLFLPTLFSLLFLLPSSPPS